jgi:hypothetical protein
MGHITDITEDPATGTIWVVGFRISRMPDISEISSESVLTREPFYDSYLAEIPDGSDEVDAVCLSNYSDPNALALPLSIVWTGTDPSAGTCWDAAECAGQPTGDATCDGSVNLADLLALKASFGKTWPTCLR